MKRVYKFLSHEHALKNLEEKHIKISRFLECNDPFELTSWSLEDKDIRKSHGAWISELNENYGMLSLCKNWRNPVMWGHYAGNHTGVCFGCDIDPSIVINVNYTANRLYPKLSKDNFFEHINKDKMIEMISTKFDHWHYEDEIRTLNKLSEEKFDDPHYFHEFSDSLSLREVIIGAKSNIKVSDVESLVDKKTVNVIKARISFKEFSVVPQRNSSLIM